MSRSVLTAPATASLTSIGYTSQAITVQTVTQSQLQKLAVGGILTFSH